MKDKFAEMKRELFEYYQYKCFVCDKPAKESAHIIGDTKANRKRYKNEIVDHPLNRLPACGNYHNGLIDAGHASAFTDYIAYLIDKGSRMGIEQAIRDNVARKQNK